MEVYGNMEFYTVDDEEPKCGLCEHFGDTFDCEGRCGSDHSWNGYLRMEKVEGN